jgi:hypothetical protein
MLHVVRGVDQGYRLFLGELGEDAHHIMSGRRVEACRRFVCYQKLRAPDQRPGNRHPLRLPSRKRVGAGARLAEKPHVGERLHCFLAPVLLCDGLMPAAPTAGQPELALQNVCKNRLAADQPVVLEDKTDLPADAPQLGDGRRRAEALAEGDDLATARRQKTDEAFEQGGFSSTVRANQGNPFARRYVEADTGENDLSVRIALRQIVCANDGCHSDLLAQSGLLARTAK